MTGVVPISAPGVSGPEHLFIPDFRAPRLSYAVPTDVSLTLPPLTMHALAGLGSKATGKIQSFTPFGMPSPPTSDCSQSGDARKQSPVSQDTTVAWRKARDTPPYSLPGSWTSQKTYTTMPALNMPEQTTYDTPSGALAVRSVGQHQLQQQHNGYSISGYGSSAMPAPSSLLRSNVVQPPGYVAHRAVLTYQTPPPVLPGAHGYASSHHGFNFQSSTGNCYHPPVQGSLPWRPSPYHHPSYIHAQTWTPASQIYKTARPTTVSGRLPREAWLRVFQFLDYADRLQHQRVNRFWAESLNDLDRRIKENPSDDQYEDMHSLVLQAENYRKHWSPSAAAVPKTPTGRARTNTRRTRRNSDTSDDVDEPSSGKKDSGLIGNIGCYHCFTVRPPEFFAMRIDDEDEAARDGDGDEDGEENSFSSPASIGGRAHLAPRRYCLDCGIKKGYHPPGKYLETKAGNNHVIWICCGGYHEYGLRNCPECGRGCPLTPVNKSSRNSRKRSSPMPPPSSPLPPPRRQRTSEFEPRQPAVYYQPYLHAQWS